MAAGVSGKTTSYKRHIQQNYFIEYKQEIGNKGPAAAVSRCCFMNLMVVVDSKAKDYVTLLCLVAALAQ